MNGSHYRGDGLWNIVPEGSKPPTGGYSSRDFIEEVKRVKFKETA